MSEMNSQLKIYGFWPSQNSNKAKITRETGFATKQKPQQSLQHCGQKLEKSHRLHPLAKKPLFLKPFLHVVIILTTKASEL